MGLDPHLDVHPNDFPIQLPVVGEVTAVLAKDSTENPSGEITLYQVDVFLGMPAMVVSLPFVPVLGQMSGGNNEQEDPLLVGQKVVVAFLEGDPNRPYIQGKWFDAQNTNVAQATADHPKCNWKRNGLQVTIDSAGDAVLSLAEGKKLSIKDSGGNVLFEITKASGVYKVLLGGDSGLRKLVTSDLISSYNDHVHPAGTPNTGTPVIPLTSAVVTAATEAK